MTGIISGRTRGLETQHSPRWVLASLILAATLLPAQATTAQSPAHPFPRRAVVPEFPRDTEWLNTGRSLQLKDLRGKFVLLDFWTYCCINCIHILPELKKLEHAYPQELVVVGVHSAKFETEKDRGNIEEAILRYEIEHPVINDADRRLWKRFGVRSWPTVLLIDPEGQAVWGRGGEIESKDVAEVLERGLPYYRQQGLLDEKPLEIELLAEQQADSPLLFPGKVLADADSDRLFIADSNHNRIVISTLDGQLLDVVGDGSIGEADGGFAEASFDHPQGMALHGDQLFVADTENHLIRRIDLAQKQVSTLAGTGVQNRQPWPGIKKSGSDYILPERFVGSPKETALNSPWALWVHDEALYIAMAGPHQIWKMPLDLSEIGPYAGNGREDIVDGGLLPPQPYQLGFSSFAQPSGLASDGEWLYVADSEGSSIRAVPFDPSKQVKTVVGTAKLPRARLFTFGDRDGPARRALLQHVLGVVHHEGQLYIADTYNNKIKRVDAGSGETRTIAGTGRPGSGNQPAEFDEPAGIAFANGRLYVADTNNHAIRVVELASGEVRQLEIQGLAPPSP